MGTTQCARALETLDTFDNAYAAVRAELARVTTELERVTTELELVSAQRDSLADKLKGVKVAVAQKLRLYRETEKSNYVAQEARIALLESREAKVKTDEDQVRTDREALADELAQAAEAIQEIQERQAPEAIASPTPVAVIPLKRSFMFTSPRKADEPSWKRARTETLDVSAPRVRLASWTDGALRPYVYRSPITDERDSQGSLQSKVPDAPIE
ncbi:hypothetical protein B0H15DRAFT_953206 [Mycena belliarum]|uniref:Uncharacterized protein n=1 Tax=Mycena belliarum TaxID=1033014 RepID=A0AAD6TX12_9AGAR|nr:hypothetical protein B0H15DRAFT_953206 [Mycena belliae]